MILPASVRQTPIWTRVQRIFRKSGHRFSVENAIKQTDLARIEARDARVAASPTSSRAFLSDLIVSIAIRDAAVANRDTADSRDSTRIGGGRKRIPRNYTKKFFSALSGP
jgi:hypothetical protein